MDAQFSDGPKAIDPMSVTTHALPALHHLDLGNEDDGDTSDKKDHSPLHGITDNSSAAPAEDLDRAYRRETLELLRDIRNLSYSHVRLIDPSFELEAGNQFEPVDAAIVAPVSRANQTTPALDYRSLLLNQCLDWDRKQNLALMVCLQAFGLDPLATPQSAIEFRESFQLRRWNRLPEPYIRFKLCIRDDIKKSCLVAQCPLAMGTPHKYQKAHADLVRMVTSAWTRSNNACFSLEPFDIYR